MKRILITIIAALAIAAGLVVSMTAPWWVVWFICLPVIFAGAVTIIAGHTNWITTYGDDV